MSRSRSLLGGLVTAGAAALTLAGCHSGAVALGGGSTPTSGGSSSGSGSSSAPASQVATTSGSGAAWFPTTVGDTWVYSVNLSGQQDTTTNKVIKVSPVSAGSQVTMADSTTNPAGTSTVSWLVHPDGSVAMPSFDAGANASFHFKIDSGGLAWPSAAQLATGKSFNEKIVATGEAGGTKITETVNAVFKGEGTQSVTVPAGTYTATVLDDLETEKILGHNTTFDTKTWLVAGIGPVKTVMTGAISETEVLTSFTKG